MLTQWNYLNFSREMRHRVPTFALYGFFPLALGLSERSSRYIFK